MSERGALKQRLGVDVGGTFTDFVLLDEETGELTIHKCLTTPSNPSDAVVKGMEQIDIEEPGFVSKLDELIHGTTLVINAIIERKGARTGLITTKGFRDILELGREIRYAPFDIMAEFPLPLVPRELRVEVDERVAADGSILTPLETEQARQAINGLLDRQVDSIAVCLLNSYANPVHEQELKSLITEIAPGIPFSISYDVLPQIREFERTSTTVTNAYVKPLTEEYLTCLSSRLEEIGFSGRLFIMLSSGGITSVETAAEHPVRIIESGPTAAVIAGQYYGRLFDISEMFCFDMGGTTAKSCLIQDGVAGVVPTFEVGRVQRFMRGSGLKIQVPVVDLMEIGAGGGSIARIGRMGTLQVGPESAGAEPGPCCYGQGGSQPTVTDADLVLGYLDADHFLGGTMQLDIEAARLGIEECIAVPLGISLVQAAWGIHDMINETMAAAAKTHIAEKGGDPVTVTLAAFGGAGPVHAAGLAQKIGASRVVIPPHAGVGSALGFFTAPRAFDTARSHKVALSEIDLKRVDGIFEQLGKEGEIALGLDAGEEGVTHSRSLDARFIGQGSETNVPLPSGDLATIGTEGIRNLFDVIYERLYGRTYPDTPLELVNLRLRSSLPVKLLDLPSSEISVETHPQALKGERLAFSEHSEDFIPHQVWDRHHLTPGDSFHGPAIVEESESTLIVPSGAMVEVDEYGFLWCDLTEVMGE